MARKYSNTFAETTLSGSITNSATTITIGSTTGLPASFPYTLAVDYGTSLVEMVTVTALAGSNLTVTRGQDGTSAQAHSAGARVVHPVSARDLSEPQVHMDATSDVHGLTGGSAVAGTSQAQTLTNKTISGSNNTLTNIPNTALVAVDAAKVTQPFAVLTVTGANGAAQVETVTGDEVTRTTPIATWKRAGIGLVVGEDAVAQVTSALSVDTVQRTTGAGALVSRVRVVAAGRPGLVVDQNAAETHDLIRGRTSGAATVFKVESTGNVTSSGTITGASAAISGAATVGTTLGVTGALTASGGVAVTGNVTASGALNGATAAISGSATVGSAGITVTAETWHAMTLVNSWTNFGGGFVAAQYRKVPSPANSVEIVGTIGGGTANTTITTLPAGYRPTNSVRVLIYAFGPSLSIVGETPGMTIDSSGVVSIVGTTNATILAFHATIPLDA